VRDSVGIFGNILKDRTRITSGTVWFLPRHAGNQPKFKKRDYRGRKPQEAPRNARDLISEKYQRIRGATSRGHRYIHGSCLESAR